ncbi:MAG: hypothetical protein WCK51_07365 [Armatimonadota bacterium]
MRFLVALLGIAALTGCARTSSTTVVDANGDWHRTVKLTISKGMGVNDPAAAAEEWPTPFKLPTGAEWSKTESVKEDEKTITLSRDVKAGDTQLTDIVGQDEKSKKTTLKNFVQVKEIEPGVFEYYEKIVNPNPDKTPNSDIVKFKESLGKALPAGVSLDDEDANLVAKQMVVSVSRIMFGPDDHLFGSIITNPEGAGRRLKVGLGKVLDTAFKTHLSAKLNDGQRKEVIAKLMAEVDGESIKNSKKSDASPDKAGEGSFVGMSVSVKFPGEIISTNGEIDPYTGEVFWDFLSASAEIEPLELRVRFRVK